MPGKALGVERELRWRIKRAFDAAGVRIVGGPPAGRAAGRPPRTHAAVAASAFASVSRSLAANVLPLQSGPNLSKH